MTPSQMNGKWLRQRVENAKTTQAAFADALGISERSLRRYLADDQPIPRVVELAIYGLRYREA